MHTAIIFACCFAVVFSQYSPQVSRPYFGVVSGSNYTDPPECPTIAVEGDELAADLLYLTVQIMYSGGQVCQGLVYGGNTAIVPANCISLPYLQNYAACGYNGFCSPVAAIQYWSSPSNQVQYTTVGVFAVLTLNVNLYNPVCPILGRAGDYVLGNYTFDYIDSYGNMGETGLQVFNSAYDWGLTNDSLTTGAIVYSSTPSAIVVLGLAIFTPNTSYVFAFPDAPWISPVSTRSVPTPNPVTATNNIFLTQVAVSAVDAGGYVYGTVFAGSSTISSANTIVTYLTLPLNPYSNGADVSGSLSYMPPSYTYTPYFASAVRSATTMFLINEKGGSFTNDSTQANQFPTYSPNYTPSTVKYYLVGMMGTLPTAKPYDSVEINVTQIIQTCTGPSAAFPLPMYISQANNTYVVYVQQYNGYWMGCPSSFPSGAGYLLFTTFNFVSTNSTGTTFNVTTPVCLSQASGFTYMNPHPNMVPAQAPNTGGMCQQYSLGSAPISGTLFINNGLNQIVNITTCRSPAGTYIGCEVAAAQSQFGYVKFGQVAVIPQSVCSIMISNATAIGVTRNFAGIINGTVLYSYLGPMVAFQCFSVAGNITYSNCYSYGDCYIEFVLTPLSRNLHYATNTLPPMINTPAGAVISYVDWYGTCQPPAFVTGCYAFGMGAQSLWDSPTGAPTKYSTTASSGCNSPDVFTYGLCQYYAITVTVIVLVCALLAIAILTLILVNTECGNVFRKKLYTLLYTAGYPQLAYGVYNNEPMAEKILSAPRVDLDVMGKYVAAGTYAAKTAFIKAYKGVKPYWMKAGRAIVLKKNGLVETNAPELPHDVDAFEGIYENLLADKQSANVTGAAVWGLIRRNLPVILVPATVEPEPFPEAAKNLLIIAVIFAIILLIAFVSVVSGALCGLNNRTRRLREMIFQTYERTFTQRGYKKFSPVSTFACTPGKFPLYAHQHEEIDTDSDFEPEGVSASMHPHDRRLRNLSYASRLPARVYMMVEYLGEILNSLRLLPRDSHMYGTNEYRSLLWDIANLPSFLAIPNFTDQVWQVVAADYYNVICTMLRNCKHGVPYGIERDRKFNGDCLHCLRAIDIANKFLDATTGKLDVPYSTKHEVAFKVLPLHPSMCDLGVILSNKLDEPESLVDKQSNSRGLIFKLFALCLCLTTVFGQPCMPTSTFYSQPQDLGSGIVQNNLQYNPYLPYNTFSRVFNGSSFQAQPTQQVTTYTATSGSCVSGMCQCSLKATANNVPIYPNAVLAFNYQCGTSNSMTNILVSSIQPVYNYVYQYSTSMYDFVVEELFSCTGFCTSASCLPLTTRTNGLPFWYQLNTGVSNGLNTCCYTTAQGFAVAAGIIVPSPALEVHVFQAQLQGIAVYVCEQNVNGVQCYEAAESTDNNLIVTLQNVIVPSTFPVGVYVKNNVPISAVTGNIPLNVQTPTWGTFGDFTFQGHTQTCGYVSPAFPANNPISFGAWTYNSCTNPNQASVNTNYLSQVSWLPSGLSKYQSEVNGVFRLQDNDNNLRYTSMSLGWNSGTPVFSAQTEYINTLSVANVVYNGIVASSQATMSDWTNAISSISIASCTGQIGGSLESHCVINVNWKLVSNNIPIYVNQYAVSNLALSYSVLLQPAFSVYYWRIVFFASTTSISFDVYLNGNVVATLTTTNVVTSPSLANDTVPYLANAGTAATQIQGIGNYAFTGYNEGIIIGCICVAIAIVLLILAVVIWSCINCCHYRKILKNLGYYSMDKI